MKSKIFLISSVLVLSVFSIFIYKKNNQNTLRQPNSFLVSKHNKPIKVLIESKNGIPLNDEQEIILIATITLHRDIPGDLRFQWSLPAGAEVVSGHIEDSFANVKPGQTVTTELTLTGISREGIPKLVTLHAYSEEMGTRMGASGVFTTQAAKVVMPIESKLKKQSNLKEVHF